MALKTRKHRPAPSWREIAALRPELSFLFRLAKVCKARREVVRGKPRTSPGPTTPSSSRGRYGE